MIRKWKISGALLPLLLFGIFCACQAIWGQQIADNAPLKGVRFGLDIREERLLIVIQTPFRLTTMKRLNSEDPNVVRYELKPNFLRTVSAYDSGDSEWRNVRGQDGVLRSMEVVGVQYVRLSEQENSVQLMIRGSTELSVGCFTLEWPDRFLCYVKPVKGPLY